MKLLIKGEVVDLIKGEVVNWKLELTLKFCNLLILKVHKTFNIWKLKLQLTAI
jgi:hypothetical protein